MDLNRGYTFDVEARLKGVIWVIALFFAVVAAQLVYLQIIKGRYYRLFSENNSIKDILIPAPRGIIYDRRGRLLAENRAVFDLVVVPQYVSDTDKLSETLSTLLGINKGDILKALQEARNSPQYKPHPIVKDIGMDAVSKIKTRRTPFAEGVDYNLDGVDILYRYVRDYPDGTAAPHVLGYVREIDEERLAVLVHKYPGRYKKGDSAGVGGIEEEFDIFLRGREGREQRIVNAMGREVENAGVALELIREEAVGGSAVYLTIDESLQKIAGEQLQGKKGAVVALEPSTGEVLTLYSSPAYDLATLVSADRSDYWRALAADEARPLFNRAIQGLYPPASTYKMVSVAGALTEGVVTEGEKIHCGGGMQFGGRFFNCWQRGGHGTVDVIHAIAASCDVFFYNMGIRLGIDRLAEYARMFGFGAKTGIDLPREKQGLVPTTEWKLKTKKDKWYSSETLSAVIGQGYNLATPLQVALMGAEIANGGFRVRPHVVQKIVDSAGREIYIWPRHRLRKKIEGISDETFQIIKKGMIEVVEGDGGTAAGLRSYRLNIAGKTGTAQVVGRETKGVRLKTHAWFVGFAPSDDPKIAVAVIVEHGGSGSQAAAPIAAEIIKRYLDESGDR